MRKILSLSLIVGALAVAQPSFAQQKSNAMKEFVMSATYGVLAGTLVGAASLAFTDQPGENLQRVARGASLGLYLGIGLGAYVVYGVKDEVPDDSEIYQQPGYPGFEGEPPPEGEPQVKKDKALRHRQVARLPKSFMPKFTIAPLFDQKAVSGASAQFLLKSF